MGAGERKLDDVEADAGGMGCSGSVVVAERVPEVWMEDSVVEVCVGDDVTVWDDELDAVAIGNLIAADLDAARVDRLVSGSAVISEDSFVGGSEWRGTVKLEPLTLAGRRLIKAGCEGLIDSSDGNSGCRWFGCRWFGC